VSTHGGETLRGRDIVCFSYADWYSHWTTPQQMMSRLARDNRVLFVDQPRSFFSALKRPNAKGDGAWEGPALREVQPNLHVFHPPPRFFPVGRLPLPIATRLLGVNGAILWGMLQPVLKQLQFRDIILWNYSILHSGAVRHVPHGVHVEDIADVWEGYIASSFGRQLVRWAGERMARQADMVFPSTPAIRDAHAGYNPNMVLVPHGADYDHFALARAESTTVAQELADLPRPVIGAIGVYDGPRFDEGLVASLAERWPQRSFVLVGPTMPDVNLTRLHSCPNVYLTGTKTIEQLPHYLKAFDVALIPWKVSALTKSIFPLKLMEYLSGGKPVVAPALESLAEAGEAVYIAQDAEDFARCIDQALREDSEAMRDARQAVARGYSWDEITRRKSEAVARLAARRQ
jgi:glycosyltransferase involved in cell wall biosynthesis